ncbi:MAG: hypothetical protein R3190_16400, partial [Thermoanaerobaculia bacterium]|nr:hypothetical protein [Thermoanaerobaculia bacterium]
LKLLAGITTPTRGRVEVGGRVAAMIELGTGFHPELTGLENVYLSGAILGLSRRQVTARLDRIVAFSGLERFLDTPLKRYSSGMYVRLGFSVAAHVEPDLLLVDEVLAVGDAEFRQRCARRIEELRRRDTTILFVSHNLFLVRSICDRAAFVADGRLVKEGEVEDVLVGYDEWLHERSAATEWAVAGVPGESASVRLGPVSVVAPERAAEEPLSDRDAVEVRIAYQLAEPMRGAGVVVRFLRDDGVTCSMIRTADSGRELGDLAGTGEVVLVVEPLQLATGSYSVEARLIASVDGVAVARSHSPWFRVRGPSPGHEPESGVFVPRLRRVEVVPGDGG